MIQYIRTYQPLICINMVVLVVVLTGWTMRPEILSITHLNHSTIHQCNCVTHPKEDQQAILTLSIPWTS